jgi:hypothetical protein
LTEHHAMKAYRISGGMAPRILDFGTHIWLFLIARVQKISASRMSLGPVQPPVRWVPGALSLGVGRLLREADHSPPSSAEVKECVELYLHSPIRLHGVVLC